MVGRNETCLALIVAWARGGVIGREGELPWHEPEDLAHFKRVTLGHAIVMGRKTHASIGRALPGRRNLVVSRDPNYAAPGCEVYTSFEAAVESARTTDACPFVIGGASIYALALPHVTRMFVTELDAEVSGDVRFPAYDGEGWSEVDRRSSGDGRLLFRTLDRAV
ncbi:MAG: dihydrofolate reductase [Planctomycetota bacterium]|nr:dihydrofolate reductase [Planctomycetota bacterium]